MVDFPIHDESSVPAEAKELYDNTKARFGGFIPNVMSVMAESPAVMEAYMILRKILDAKTAFSPEEIQVLALIISAENGCEYCVAAHSFRANETGMSADVLDAIRDGRPIPDPRLAALSAFARAVVRKQGWVEEDDMQAFLAAGYDRRQILDVVLAVSWKTLSNYVNHVADTPLDSQFESMRWEKAAKVA